MTDLQYLIPWLRGVAWRINAEYADDLAQEGMIAAWRALSTHDASKGASVDTWVKKKAKFRMLELVRRGDWTGSADSTRKRYEPRSVTVEPDEMHELSVSSMLPEVEAAYHRGEIYAALNELSPADREYVYRRFWKDEVLKRHDRWMRTIKPALQEKLSHLSDTPIEIPVGALEKYRNTRNSEGMCRNGHPDSERRPDGRCRPCRRDILSRSRALNKNAEV